jgi:hypothetical protein
MHSIVSSNQEAASSKKIPQSNLTCISSNTRSSGFSSQDIEIVPEGVAYVGSVVVCQVVSVGAHDKLENLAGRYVRINPNDLIMGVMGNRESTISMYGGLPDRGFSLPREEPVHLLSGGGLIGECYSSPSYLGCPTRLRILGLASQEGKLLEITPRFREKYLHLSCPLILVAGTCANVGKTKFASKFTHFLSYNLGRNVAATKLAGAGNLDDLLSLREQGASCTFDFVDAGLVSTYGDIEDSVVETAKGVLNHLGMAQPDVIIAELGGDISGANVPAILADKEILAATSALILAPSDVFAAHGALSYLRLRNFSRPIFMAQPLKNPAISQERAKSILKSRLYDCDKTEDLSNIVDQIDSWWFEKENLIKQEPEHVGLRAITTF